MVDMMIIVNEVDDIDDVNDENADRETKLESAVYRKIGTMICITPLSDA